MDRLPTELLHNVFRIMVEDNKGDKNALLIPRLTCRAFDDTIRPYVLKTIQLDYWRLADPRKYPSLESLNRIQKECEALYCDVSMVRDEEELDRWNSVFGSVARDDPSISKFLDGFRQFCMTEVGFNEEIFKQFLTAVLENTPGLKRLRLNLPIIILMGHGSLAGTMLLATALACIFDRPEESQPLESLVLENITERSIADICRNPIDLRNARSSFHSLKNLVVKFRPNLPVETHNRFSRDFWLLMSYAEHVETLSILSWRAVHPSDKDPGIITASVDAHKWSFQSFQYQELQPQRCLKHLRCLELKNVRMWPTHLLELLEQHKTSLKELYLHDVFLKVNRQEVENNSTLWIGHGKTQPKLDGSIWFAETMLEMTGLNLNVLRATNLGYDVFVRTEHVGNPTERFDRDDPLGHGRSFEQRFVETAMGVPQPFQHSKEENVESTNNASICPYGSIEMAPKPASPTTYDISAYRATNENTTSAWRFSLDGFFENYSIGAKDKLKEFLVITEYCHKTVSNNITQMQSRTQLDS